MLFQETELNKLSKAELIAIILQMEEKLSNLEKHYEQLQHRKNSNNSSVPPSKDENRPRRRGLRVPSGKKAGGQEGHEGKTLQMTSTPDEIITHIPQYCNCCGKDLSAIEPGLQEKRQQVELPPITPIIKEHQIFSCKCSCGNIVVGTFPMGVTPGISYGESVESMVGYLSARQFVPFKRMGEIFTTVFNLYISDGAMVNALERLTQKALPAYELLRQKAIKTKVIGGDETGTKIQDKKGWFWTIQGQLFTFIIASLNRGTKTLTENFPKGFRFSIMAHDCWKSYFQIPCFAHQICIAHLLRELNYFIECHDLQWAKDLKQLFQNAVEYKKTLQPDDYSMEHLLLRTEYENQLSRLLSQSIDSKYKKVITFQSRLLKYRQHIFTFLYHRAVPPDNNSSERAIRNVKVKHKISGYFKSFAGAESFAVLRSVIDTAIKNGLNPLVSLRQIASVNMQG